MGASAALDPVDDARAKDPLLRLISVEEAPASFWQTPAQLRAERGRLYLISRCAGTDPVLAWAWAMDMSEEGNAFAREITGGHSDAAIQAAVRREFPAGL